MLVKARKLEESTWSSLDERCGLLVVDGYKYDAIAWLLLFRLFGGV